MDDAPAIILITVVLILASIGVVHLTGDFRTFGEVVEDCNRMGHVQNDKIRIKCEVEK